MSDDVSSRQASPALSNGTSCRQFRARRVSCRKTSLPTSRPKSRLCLSSSCVSSKNRMPIITPQTKTMVQIRLGSRKGNRLKSESSGNVSGQLNAGRARAPPRAGPMIELRSVRNSLARGSDMKLPKAPHKRHYRVGTGCCESVTAHNVAFVCNYVDAPSR